MYKRQTAAGALACTQFGAMQGLPTREELEQFMVAPKRGATTAAEGEERS